MLICMKNKEAPDYSLVKEFPYTWGFFITQTRTLIFFLIPFPWFSHLLAPLWGWALELLHDDLSIRQLGRRDPMAPWGREPELWRGLYLSQPPEPKRSWHPQPTRKKDQRRFRVILGTYWYFLCTQLLHLSFEVCSIIPLQSTVRSMNPCMYWPDVYPTWIQKIDRFNLCCCKICLIPPSYLSFCYDHGL